MIRRSAPLSRPCHPCGLDLRPSRGPLLKVEGPAKQALDMGRTRLLVAGLAFALAFSLLSWRLVDLGTGASAGEPRLAAAGEPLITERADILDRNGLLLATTLPTFSLYADTRQIKHPGEAAAALVAVLPDLARADLEAKLSSGKSFVWVKRALSPREQADVVRLGIPGLDFQRESVRVYPQGAVTSQLVGFTNVDNRGLAGIEQSFDERLRNSQEPLRLSVDLRLQHALAEELQATIDEFSAKGAAGLIMDIETGEVLASVSLPTYDPNEPASAGDDERFNRATMGIYEMGSTFKIFTAAMALEEGIVDLDSGYDATNPIQIGGYTIEDFKGKHRWLSVPEIFIYSSNIGAAQMGRDVGGKAQKRYLTALGLTQKPTFDLPEIGDPLVPADWREINTLTISFGHGIAVSPLQMITAVSAVVNGGVMRPATLLQRDTPAAGERVFSEETSAKLRWLLRYNVQKGSGKRAEVVGYQVGVKTWTAEKLTARSYSKNARIASFVGAFPMDAPRYVVLALIDEPQPTEKSEGYATGSWVGAPAVGRVIARVAPLLGLAPAAPEFEAEADENLISVAAGGRVLASN